MQLPILKRNPDGTLFHPIRTFLWLLFSDDSHFPSSARVLGMVILSTLSLCVGCVTGVLVYRIANTLDPILLKLFLDGLKGLTTIYLFMSATALSLYGIHVWKYISNLVSPTMPLLEKTPEEKTSPESSQTPE
jgi:hypothetical protein